MISLDLQIVILQDVPGKRFLAVVFAKLSIPFSIDTLFGTPCTKNLPRWVSPGREDACHWTWSRQDHQARWCSDCWQEGFCQDQLCLLDWSGLLTSVCTIRTGLGLLHDTIPPLAWPGGDEPPASQQTPWWWWRPEIRFVMVKVCMMPASSSYWSADGGLGLTAQL